MFNLFIRFEPGFIHALRKAEERYLVSQTYNEAIDHFEEGQKIYLLWSQYKDIGQAKIHLSNIQGDKYAAIIDLENTAHRNKIQEMMGHESLYIVYITIVSKRSEMEERMNSRYKPNLRRFIARHTDWKIGSDQTIHPSIEIAYGKIFILLRYKNQQLRVSLADIHHS